MVVAADVQTNVSIPIKFRIKLATSHWYVQHKNFCVVHTALVQHSCTDSFSTTQKIVMRALVLYG